MRKFESLDGIIFRETLFRKRKPREVQQPESDFS